MKSKNSGEGPNTIDAALETEATFDASELVDMDRRSAMKNLGALAGAAPAVIILLAPSASRALGNGGSPCEGSRQDHCRPADGWPGHGDPRPPLPGDGQGRGDGWGRPGNGWGDRREGRDGGSRSAGKSGKHQGRER